MNSELHALHQYDCTAFGLNHQYKLCIMGTSTSRVHDTGGQGGKANVGVGLYISLSQNTARHPQSSQ